MREVMFVEAVREAQAEALADDERAFVMGQEVGAYGGVFRATEGLFERFGAQRVRDMPIVEQSMIGAAVGAAVMGMRPIVEVMFMDFVACGMDAIVNHAAKLRYMSGDQIRVPIVIRTQGGSGTHHGSQHSQSLESWFLHVPGIAVVVPSTPADVKGLFKTSMDLEDPVLFVEHRALYRTKGLVEDPVAPIPLGEGVIRRSGTDVTLVSAGGGVRQALEVANQIQGEGVSVEVVDLRTLVPMDVEIVLKSLAHTHRLVVAHEATERGGWAGELVSRVVAEGFDELDAPPLRAGSRAAPIPFAEELEAAMIADERLIDQRIRETVGLLAPST